MFFGCIVIYMTIICSVFIYFSYNLIQIRLIFMPCSNNIMACNRFIFNVVFHRWHKTHYKKPWTLKIESLTLNFQRPWPYVMIILKFSEPPLLFNQTPFDSPVCLRSMPSSQIEQTLLNIRNNILHIFKPNRKPYQSRVNACCRKLFLRQLPVCSTGRVEYTGTDIRNMYLIGS